MPDDFDYSAFITQFIAECREHLETMNADLLALESDPCDADKLGEIVREAHTIKGAAKMMGAEDIATLAHTMEDLFGEVKEGRTKLDEAAIDGLFGDFDRLGEMLTVFEAGGQPAPEPAPPETKVPEATVTEIKAAEKVPENSCPAPVAAGTPAKLAPEETIRVSAKKIDDLANLAGELVINHIKQQERSGRIKDLLETYREQETRMRALREHVAALKLESELGGDLSGLESGRLSMEKALTDLKRDWREDGSQSDILIRQLTVEVLSARMVPVSTLFDTFSRPVRDLAKQFHKDLELKFEGGETEFDRRMIEIIGEPMIHMIRNAVDHGLEGPDERERAGKPRRGTLMLRARHEGEYVVIELSDDGAGIDLEKVRKKAVKAKLTSSEQAKTMGDQELMQFLFHSGFSTSDIITDISGRGVGMDVVRRKIEELKGMVYIVTEAGKGTTIVLKVPLTLAMARIMFVRAGGQQLGIPTTSIQEAVRLDPAEIKTVEGHEAIILRDHAVPVLNLAGALGLPVDSSATRAYAVIINLAGRRLGLLVDRMVGEQEVVIKTLGPHFSAVRNIAGATVLGSGRVVLILNPADLLAVSAPAAQPAHKEDGEISPTTAKRILVVDDSATARELEKNILVNAGYEVDEAVDGVDALAKVAKNRYDLLVVDVQMPRMDGLTFTKRIKSDERFADLPVIIVTTLEKEEDKQRGVAAGADAYIIKRAFDQANLLSVIEQLTAA
jgi:two-component system, chemotaxis family, sensor kinase CheA